jgi:hypothetical protein
MIALFGHERRRHEVPQLNPQVTSNKLGSGLKNAPKGVGGLRRAAAAVVWGRHGFVGPDNPLRRVAGPIKGVRAGAVGTGAECECPAMNALRRDDSKMQTGPTPANEPEATFNNVRSADGGGQFF